MPRARTDTVLKAVAVVAAAFTFFNVGRDLVFKHHAASVGADPFAYLEAVKKAAFMDSLEVRAHFPEGLPEIIVKSYDSATGELRRPVVLMKDCFANKKATNE